MIKDRLNQLTDLELELLLQQLPEVTSPSDPVIAAAEKQTPTPERKILVAYYLTKTPTGTDIEFTNSEVINGVDIDELRRHCEELLPVHMRPSQYIPVNCFPTLPNGKIAYTELKKLHNSMVTKTVSVSANKTDGIDADKISTETLSKLTEVLGRIMLMDDIRADDNFFEIGGDSITAIQFVAKMREAGYKLDLIAVSESQTIADIVPKCSKIKAEPTISDKDKATRSEKSPFDSSGLNEEELDSFLSSFD